MLAGGASLDLRAHVAAPMHHAHAIRAMFSGDLGAYMTHMRLASECFERAGDLRSSSTTRTNVAYAYTELGAYAEAERSFREVLVTAERMNLRDLAAGVRHNLGIALARQGALEEARVVESLAAEFAVAQKNRRLEGGCRTYLAIILLLASDLQGAEREARAAVDILSLAPSMRANGFGTLGRVLLAQGRAANAMQATHEAMALIASLSGLEEGESLVRLAHIEALLANGDVSAARSTLAVARDRLLARAGKISDPAWRESFLNNVADNARILELARAWLDESG
jgi:tetratricopeptide (TPR) repeat protein